MRPLPPGLLQVTGTLTLRLSVRGADGSVAGVAFLADTLVPLPPYERGEGGQIRAAVQVRAVKDGARGGEAQAAGR